MDELHQDPVWLTEGSDLISNSDMSASQKLERISQVGLTKGGGSGGDGDGAKHVIDGSIEQLGRLTAQDQSPKVVTENVKLTKILLLLFVMLPFSAKWSII
ncbi:hypothetical protein HPB48_009170 [Haemaphysalis longicornis]|uniref:Uncharacterized protein n=1 Tax=Haemaphysalis longicornis TaxID=44386 RepID=A0A9J6GA93_HAELO|nr:hypothetical protein HPB48_009170 [Haemaphysalis longicornis]